MTIYTFYRITHKDYPELNYIGSTQNLKRRAFCHKTRARCLNKKSSNYNNKLYQTIRKNEIKFDELIFEILMECDTNIHLKLETMFVQQYNSIEKGVNEVLPKKNPDYNKLYRVKNKEKYKEYNKLYKQTEKYKTYVEKNRQIKNERAKQKIHCDICNKEIRRDGINKHKKNKHS